MFERVSLVLRCRDWGIEPCPGEPTKALSLRLRATLSLRLRFAGSRSYLEFLTGGKVETRRETGEVVITLPAGTSVARVAEVEALCLDHVPADVAATVRIEGQS